jgi:DNA-binding GntR family transcriptional regulator
MMRLSQVQAVAPEVGLTQRAYDEIGRAILTGVLPQGSLTSVRALSQALQISRTPVREALVALADDRLVAFEKNRGVRIIVTQRHDIEEIFAVRMLLEVPSIRTAVERMQPLDIDELRQHLVEMEANLEDEDEFMCHDWRFHRKLLEMAGNGRILSIVESVRNQTRARGISTVGRSRPLESILNEHRAIYSAVGKRDTEGAVKALTEHLNITQELLLAQEDLAGSAPENQEES